MKMNNQINQKPKYKIFTLLSLTFLLISFSTIVSCHSQSTIHETNKITHFLVATLNQTISKIKLSSSNFLYLQNHLGPKLTHLDRSAFKVCLELLDNTISDLKTAISKLQSHSLGSQHVHMLFSIAMTNQDTCLDGFTTSNNENNNVKTYALDDSLKESMLNISNHISNCLNLLQKLPQTKHSPEAYDVDVKFPNWISKNDKSLLQAAVRETKFNLIVAKDGTGDFKTISSAVSAAPNLSKTRFTIYIKAGEYYEYVEIPKTKTMIMFVGDGIGKTIIKGNRSHVGGWDTFYTATVCVSGADFIAKNISFVNFAGPEKKQAVALRSDSRHSAFYLCSFEGYQDTLYVHSEEQFYRECQIFGTIDFICGDATVVFQKCDLYARKPIKKQEIVFTAQKRNSPKDFTGISLINCRILAAPDLVHVKKNFKAYLGRPWGVYSRTILINSFIDDLIDPAGWLEWNKTARVDKLYYGEYMNTGPGADVTNRVKWPGYRHIKTAAEAAKFTVGPLIHGNAWINSTGIPYTLGLF